MNMSIKEIISNATSQMEQSIEIIKDLKSRLGELINNGGPLTETEQLYNDMEVSIERLNDFLEEIKNERLREVITPVGTIYIEHFSFREEYDRIKIYDSDKKYIDYISSEAITDSFKLKEYIEILKKCFNIEELLNHIAFVYDEYSVCWEKIANELVERKEHQINSVGELLENEWVNRIGDYYILMTEC